MHHFLFVILEENGIHGGWSEACPCKRVAMELRFIVNFLPFVSHIFKHTHATIGAITLHRRNERTSGNPSVRLQLEFKGFERFLPHVREMSWNINLLSVCGLDKQLYAVRDDEFRNIPEREP